MNDIKYEKYPATFCDLGLIRYDECLNLQECVRRRVMDNQDNPGYLFFLEHPPVFTHGRLASDENLLFDLSTLIQKGIDVRRIDRGGDFTFHGPGQLVVYPIFNLKRIHMNLREYLHALEEVIIRVLSRLGIISGREKQNMGVWVDDRKICAIGVGVKKWVSKHGLAFNLNTDLSYFDGIIPCGIGDKGVTSMKEIRDGVEQDWNEISRITREEFVKLFRLEIEERNSEDLMEMVFAGQREKTPMA